MADAKKDLITEWRKNYDKVLTEAQISAEHTKTTGWQDIYLAWKRDEQALRLGLAAQLKALSERLELGMLSEDEEKVLADVRKSCVTLGDSHDSFERQTLDKIKACVNDAETVIQSAKSAAINAESATPMYAGGAGARMVMEIATWPRVVWDGDTGVVKVVASEPVVAE